ncbi:hypothetical protein NQ318_023039 [Aromia moschata]|uniref:Uncharacterized protein n=1 Tax=Aromia moschata TaxID=1265417 RepID=A0AAV8XXX4_9CUCU|nr:hypothetical protein NQ318_023039 [Aromia moschata]
MPLPKRVIEPVYVTRGTLPEDYPLPSELEGVTNGTLANTVRQLSSLSRRPFWRACSRCPATL